MSREKRILAACGLVCNECDIFLAENDPQLAREIVDWFQKERNLDLKVEQVGCSGCKGDRSSHWSPDCDILNCCVDEKILEFCYQCGNFPCDKLTNRAKQNSRYREALNRLTRMKEEESRD